MAHGDCIKSGRKPHKTIRKFKFMNEKPFIWKLISFPSCWIFYSTKGNTQRFIGNTQLYLRSCVYICSDNRRKLFIQTIFIGLLESKVDNISNTLCDLQTISKSIFFLKLLFAEDFQCHPIFAFATPSQI